MAHTTFNNNLFVLSRCIFTLLFIVTASSINGITAKEDWLSHGGDSSNRRYANMETKISPETVSNLTMKWEFYAGSDITATPAIYDDTLYFPSWNGYIYAVNRSDGALLWKQKLSELTGINVSATVINVNTTLSRTTPAIADDLLIYALWGPAAVIGVERLTGKLVWFRRLDYHNSSVITMSGTYHNGSFYVGTSSLEEGLPIDQCCTFRGSFFKLNAKTGKIIWQTYMLPDNFGKKGLYAGAAIWGSSPSLDPKRNLVYISTGNLYSAPPNISECQNNENNQTRPTHPDECVEPDNHSESFLALDLDTGSIKWYHQLGGYDVWFIACTYPYRPYCSPGPNPDADFGEAPMMLTIYVNGSNKDIVVAVQKSGFAWALDRDNGTIVWSTEAGPGGYGGGGTWGSATDEERVYTNIANSDRKNFTLIPSSNVTTSGGWVAMDAKTGKILWSTGDPSNGTVTGPVTVANGVLFGGSTFRTGPLYAIDAKKGNILWSYETGSTINGGLSVSDGCVYIGNGYQVSTGFMNPAYTSGTSLYAFCV